MPVYCQAVITSPENGVGHCFVKIVQISTTSVKNRGELAQKFMKVWDAMLFYLSKYSEGEIRYAEEWYKACFYNVVLYLDPW